MLCFPGHFPGSGYFRHEIECEQGCSQRVEDTVNFPYTESIFWCATTSEFFSTCTTPSCAMENSLWFGFEMQDLSVNREAAENSHISCFCVAGSDPASGALQVSPGQQHLPSFGCRENSISHRFISSDTKVFPTAWLNFSSARYALKNASKQIVLGLRAERGGRKKFGDKECGQPTSNLELILFSTPEWAQGPQNSPFSVPENISFIPVNTWPFLPHFPASSSALDSESTEMSQKYHNIHAARADPASSHSAWSGSTWKKSV